MTKPKQSIRDRLFSTVGADNDRIVPWRTPLTTFPVLLVVLSIGWTVMHNIGITEFDWPGPPMFSGLLTIFGLCGNADDGSKLRHQAAAIATAAGSWVLLTFVGVWLFSAAGHLHPGPVRGALYLAASVVAIAAFTTVTRRQTRPVQA